MTTQWSITNTIKLFKQATARIRADAEIIRGLREALRSIAANTCCERCQEAALVARAVLNKKE